MNAIQFQNMIRKVLLEEVEKRSSTDKEIYERVPEVNHAEEYEDITPHERDGRTKDEILDLITKTAKAVDSSVVVVWDDHDDISVSARDMFRVRISPRWENSYNIEAFIRNEDRIYVTNQTLDQVNAFLKVNLKNATTATEKAYGKAAESRKDQTPSPDKGLPQKDKPKTMPLTNEAPKTSKSKDKNYTEKQTKEEKDLPEKPMREVGKFEKQIDHKVKDPVKLRRRKPDTKLTVPVSKQDTSKL
jgi:hypothetical protein